MANIRWLKSPSAAISRMQESPRSYEVAPTTMETVRLSATQRDEVKREVEDIHIIRLKPLVFTGICEDLCESVGDAEREVF